MIDVVNSEAYLSFFRDYMAEGYLGSAPTDLLDAFTRSAASLSSAQAAGLLQDSGKLDFRAPLKIAATEIPSLIIVREDWSDDAR